MIPATMSGGGLYSGFFARGEAAAAAGDGAFLQAMLDVEIALLGALADVGLADPDAAAAVPGDASAFDLEEIGRSTGEQGTPVPALLGALRARLSEAGAKQLHRGATSQDIVDTAGMLVAHRALGPLIDDLTASADACAQLAREHRRTLMPGRTLLQHALPVTFGLKAANWLVALDGARAELLEVRERTLAIQLGGAVGTLAALGDRGLDVAAGVAARLRLPAPELPWHANRLRPARLAGALGSALGAMAKIAKDVVLLAQTELAEVSEGGSEGRGGSSTLPHKRNPVGAVGVLACAQRGPGLVATVLSAMTDEHERGAGPWQAEWETILELLRIAGSAASLLRGVVGALEVDAGKMRADLDAAGGVMMSESVATALAEAGGRERAQRLVQQAARRAAEHRRPFREVLLELPEVREALGPGGVDRALDPQQYLGVAGELIDRALEAHGS